jgi:DNA-binding IclR family transcriptional regulator
MLLTIDSAGDVLSLFTKDVPEHGVTEVAQALGLSKSKAHQLLASLADVGLLRRTPQSRYRVGWRVMTLSHVLAETTDFQQYARPVLAKLGEHCGELVHLGVLDDGEAMCLDRVDGRQAVRIEVSSLGNRLWAHCNGVGKVLLASLEPDALDIVIERHGLPRLTARTITSRKALDRELEAIRRRGFAIESGEAVPEVSCVAAPIVSPGPRVVAALSMSVPTHRFEARKDIYNRAIVRAASYVSRQLARAEETAATRDAARGEVALVS